MAGRVDHAKVPHDVRVLQRPQCLRLLIDGLGREPKVAETPLLEPLRRNEEPVRRRHSQGHSEEALAQLGTFLVGVIGVPVVLIQPHVRIERGKGKARGVVGHVLLPRRGTDGDESEAANKQRAVGGECGRKRMCGARRSGGPQGCSRLGDPADGAAPCPADPLRTEETADVSSQTNARSRMREMRQVPGWLDARTNPRDVLCTELRHAFPKMLVEFRRGGEEALREQELLDFLHITRPTLQVIEKICVSEAVLDGFGDRFGGLAAALNFFNDIVHDDEFRFVQF